MNKQSVKIVAFIMFAFLCNQNVFAQKVITGTKELPLELNLLIAGLQDQSPDNYKKILPIVMNIDLYARSLSKEDIFLIGKIEVYKTLLKNYGETIKQPVDGVTISTLRAALAKTSDSFTKWFLQALLKDTMELTGNPRYKELLLLKNTNTRIEKLDYKKLEKKSELIQYWVSKISPEAQDFPDNLRNDLAPRMIDALNNIQHSFYLIAQEGTLAPVSAPLKNESELKFFIVKDEAVKGAPIAVEQKTVEEILAPITNPNKPLDLPVPSQENWLEDQNAPPTLQNLPKPNNDADWLQDF